MDKKKQEWEVVNEMAKDGTILIEQGEQGPEIILTEQSREKIKFTLADLKRLDPELQEKLGCLAEGDFELDGKSVSFRKALILGELLMKLKDGEDN